MAVGQFGEAMVPITENISVTTAAARVKSSSVLSTKFTLIAPAANTVNIYVGDANVAANRGIPIAAGQFVTFGEDEPNSSTKYQFDLAEFYLRSTANTQVCTLMRWRTFRNSTTG